jgi:hypothetical protein
LCEVKLHFHNREIYYSSETAVNFSPSAATYVAREDATESTLRAAITYK